MSRADQLALLEEAYRTLLLVPGSEDLASQVRERSFEVAARPEVASPISVIRNRAENDTQARRESA